VLHVVVAEREGRGGHHEHAWVNGLEEALSALAEVFVHRFYSSPAFD